MTKCFTTIVASKWLKRKQVIKTEWNVFQSLLSHHYEYVNDNLNFLVDQNVYDILDIQMAKI
jgi:hypothetical protein